MPDLRKNQIMIVELCMCNTNVLAIVTLAITVNCEHVLGNALRTTALVTSALVIGSLLINSARSCIPNQGWAQDFMMGSNKIGLRLP